MDMFEENPKKGPIIYHDTAFQQELIRSGTRQQIIEWLEWNDPNCTYTNRDSTAEGYLAITRERAVEIMLEQVARGNEVSEQQMGIAETYGVSDDVMDYVNSGFLKVLAEKPAETTVEFYIPDLEFQDEQGNDTTFTIIWIHPDHNAQFCHYYTDTPGDLPNFYVMKQTETSGDECLDVPTLDDLIAWFEDKKEIVDRRS